jgi:TRAP transporter TAXI family solute receptor
MMVRILSAVVLLFMLSACSFGPDADALRKGVSERLAQALPGDTFSLASFERRGSQSDSKAPTDETRRIVYFDVRLKLERNFDFGAWDGPGLAGLVSALGTGPKGIAGITSGGNKAGDIISAHGTAIYKKEGDAWRPVLSGAYRPTEAPSYATNASTGPAAILDAMRQVIDSVPREGAIAQRAVIAEELAAAYAAIRARMVRTTDGYAIAAGPEHGQYLLFAKALSDDRTARTVPLVTQGGEENIQLLREGKVPLALAQGDAALQAYEGQGAFANAGPYSSLQAIGSLYPEPVHVLVRADSGFGSFNDLGGKRVAIGRQGAASRTTALRVLQAHGMGIKDITPLDLPLGEALIALRNKRVDAVIQVIGMPANSIRDALSQIPLRLLPLSAKAAAAMAESKSGYFVYTIPAGTYANQTQAVSTVATAALLLVDGDLSETEVGGIARFVYAKGQDFVVRGSAQGAQVAASSARQGLTVPMHISAAKVLDAPAGK